MAERKSTVGCIVIAAIIIVLLFVAICYFVKTAANQFAVAGSAMTGAGAGSSAVERSTGESKATSAGSKCSSPSFKGRTVEHRQVGASAVVDDSVVPPDGGSSASEFFSTTNKP